jgi:hypothetical protein
MIRVRMGDDGTFHPTPRVDIEITVFSVKTAGSEVKNFVHLVLAKFLYLVSRESFAQ